MESTELNKLSH